MDTYDLIVIGGGISGLTLARRGAAHGWKTLLLEKEIKVGGCLATHRFEGPAQGFWAELGAHTCYNSYGALLELLADDLKDRMQARHKAPWRVWDGQRLQSVFARMHWPTLLPSLPRLFVTSKAGQGLKDYYSRVLGRRTYEGLLRHAFNAVIAQPADDFPADLLFRKKERRQDIPRSYTFTNGLTTLAEGLAAGQAFELGTGADIQGVARTDSGFELATGQGALACRRLALAVPAWEAARLIEETYPELAASLARIAPAEVESLAVALPRDAVKLPEVAGLIGVDQDFYSAVSRDVVPDTAHRGFSFHFRPGRLDRRAKLERVAQVLGVPVADLTLVGERLNRLPALKAGHMALVAELDRLLAGQPLALTGNYFYGVSIGDCAERSAAEFARLKHSHPVRPRPPLPQGPARRAQDRTKCWSRA